MVSLAESSIVNISMGDSAKLALAFPTWTAPPASPEQTQPWGPRCRREQLFGFLARPAADDTLRLKQPRH
jgi:hypothetical protein